MSQQLKSKYAYHEPTRDVRIREYGGSIRALSVLHIFCSVHGRRKYGSSQVIVGTSTQFHTTTTTVLRKSGAFLSSFLKFVFVSCRL